MASPLRSRVPPTADGRELAAWLAERFRYFDGDAWRAEIAAGRLTVNGLAAREDLVLHAGDAVQYTPAEPDAPNVDVPVLHEDDDLLVVDKPPHLAAHATGAFLQNTVLHALGARSGPGVSFVHRLDRETSGVLVLARHARAAAALQRQFESGTVEKVYVAVVHGEVAADTFVVDAAIGRARQSTVAARRAAGGAAGPDARTASTTFSVQRRLRGHTVLLARPHTGRTHQIRVHLEHVGHAIVGDKLYGRDDASYERYVQRAKGGGDPGRHGMLAADRHLLHARALTCRHPRTGAVLTFEAPVPADVERFVAAHRLDA